MPIPITKTHHSQEEPPRTRIIVNLLPSEILMERKQSYKILLINKISIAALLVLIFFASATFGLRIYQGMEFKNVQDNLVYAEGKVASLQDKEGQLLTLKQRLEQIQKLLEGDNKRKGIFNLLIFLVPSEIQISEMSVDKNGEANISLTSSQISSITTLFSNLSSKEKNGGLISKVELQGLSLGRDGVYRFALRIIPKK